MGALLSGLVGFLVNQLTIKFVLFTALVLVVSSICNYIGGMIPSPQDLSGAIAQLPSGVWYFMDVFGLDYGLPMVISAYILRFSIRRIPFFG